MKKMEFLLAIAAAAMIFGNTLIYAQTADVTAIADTIDPSDVENVKATPGNNEVLLSWDAATDNVGVIGYKIYRGTHSVESTQDAYDLPVISIGNVKNYAVKNLTNNQTYFFAVTALDAAGNESANYSLEASATPANGLMLAALEDNGKPPELKIIEAVNLITVKVLFSEPIKLPEEHPASAFTIEKTADKARLEVQKAELDNNDATGATVLLMTAPQEKDAEYRLTVGIEIQDYSGNSVITGMGNTITFKGGAKDSAKQNLLASTESAPAELMPAAPTPAAAPTTDAAAPSAVASVIVTALADYNNRVSVNFSGPIALSSTPKNHFTFTKKGSDEQLKIINVNLSVDGKTVFITTEPQQVIDYELRVMGVKDIAGNELIVNPIIVTGRGASIEDLIPPEDVTNLIAKIKNAKANLVELRWKASKNSAGDLSNQLLYQSPDRKGQKFGMPTSLGSSTAVAEVHDLQGGQWYTFKVTTKDAAGNESKGAIKSLFLPQTGPGVIVAGLTAIAMAWWRRRRRY